MAGELGLTIALGAQLTSGFKGSFTSAQSHVRLLDQTVRHLENSPTGKLGAALARDGDKVRTLAADLRSAKGQLAALKAQADASGGAHGVLARRIKNAERTVENLNRSLKKAVTAQGENVARAHDLCGSVSKLREEYRGLSRDVDKARQRQEKLAANMAARQAETSRRSELRGRVFDTVATAAPVVMTAKLAISAEDTFADLKKVLPDMTDEQLQATFNDALDLSKKTGKSFEEVVQIMTAGAQAGLGKTREEMLAVTEQALHMSVAWGVAPEEAGKSLATWQASMNLTMAQSKELADTINVLSDNMNAEAGEINSITIRMGPLMQSMGFGTRGIAAFSAAFKAAGVDVSSAGTGLKNMTKVMVAGSAGLTKERRQIFAGLGINPDVLAKQMVDDAEGATVMVLDALSKVAPEKLSSLSMRLFGDESIVAIAPMIKNLNLLKGAITTAYGNVDDSVLKEYNNRMSTTAAAVSRSTANIRGLGIEIGNTLLPAIKSGTGMVDRFVSGIRGCVREHPRLTKAVVIGASALAALSVAGLVGAYAFSGLKSAWLGAKGAALLLTGAETRLWAAQKAGAVASLSWKSVISGSASKVRALAQGIATFTGIQKGATVSTVLLTTVQKIWGVGAGIVTGAWKAVGMAVRFAFGPVGILLGVLAIGAGLIMDNWDTVGPYFQALWDGVVGCFKKAWESVKWIVDKIAGAVGWIGDAISSIPGMESVKNGWKKGWNFITGGDDSEQPESDGKQPEPVAAESARKTQEEEKKQEPAASRAARETQAQEPAVASGSSGSMPMPDAQNAGVWQAVGNMLGIGQDSEAVSGDSFGYIPPTASESGGFWRGVGNLFGIGGGEEHQPAVAKRPVVRPASSLRQNMPQEKPQPAVSAERALVGSPAPSPRQEPATQPSRARTSSASLVPASSPGTASAQEHYAPARSASMSPQSSSQRVQPTINQISIPMQFDVRGLDKAEFSRKVQECRSEFEKIIKRVVADMEHQKARVAYGG